VATYSVPDLDAKNLWRRLRASIWTAWVALAVCALLLPSWEPVPFLTGLKNWLILSGAVIVVWPMMAKRFHLS
jgi:purine-cytosine permease-like protein